MKIYSFEFGFRPIKWELNTYKEMTFLGTISRKFPQNRNLLRLDIRGDVGNVEITPGTYYKPAITSNTNGFLTANPLTLNTLLSETDARKNICQDAIISVDYECYRVVGYCAMDMQPDDTPGAISYEPDLLKAVSGDDVSIAVLSFEQSSGADEPARSTFVLVLYNKFMRKYEYYTIGWKYDGYREDNTLVCENVIDDIPESVMDEWKKTDEERKYQNCFFKPQFATAVTKYTITSIEYDSELHDILPWFDDGINSEVIVIDTSESVQEITNYILDHVSEKTRAITWFGIDPIIPKNKDNYPIYYNLIMDATGKVTT